MRLPVAWLKEYLPKLPATEKLVETVMMHGLDVEDVMVSASFNHVVVGQIVGIKPHPNADKLRIAEVITSADKSSSARQEIVCGAPNIEVGQKVPVALLGAKLPNGMTIEPRAIRGVTSNGMLCAKDELGLGTDHSGIMVLDEELKVGTPFIEVIGSNDGVIDLAIPANRADLMSMRGLAWEIGAMLDLKPKFPKLVLKESTVPASKSISVHSADPHLCSLFTARVIRGLHASPTPAKIVQRLTASGMRSINLIVDVTNYVMLEYGQPLHAYDAHKISGATLTARSAQAGERLITLDNHARTLTPDTLVIADANGPVGLAGVMGGLDSEVSASTTDIILEAAIFNSVSIRKTSRRLGLISEASKRFERGLWSEVTMSALDAAAAIIVDLGGGTIEQGRVTNRKTSSIKRTVKLAPQYIAERLGMKLTMAQAKKVLQQLGFVVGGTTKQWTVTVPVWRPDVTLPEDIVDEVGRMVGYGKLPKLMTTEGGIKKDLPPAIRFKEEVRNILVEMGFTEVISHAFYSEINAGVVGGNHFEVANPLDETQHKLRKSILPEVIEILERQGDAGRDAMIFEIGNIFNPELPGPIEKQQRWKLVVGVVQKRESTIESLVAELQERLATKVQPTTRTGLPVVIARGRRVDVREFDLSTLMAGSSIEFGTWDPMRHISHNVKYKEQSKYPAIKRDISISLPINGINADQIEELINREGGEIVTDVEVKKDTYQGKSTALCKIIFQSDERTLTKAEVDEQEGKIKAALIKRGAIIR